MKVFKTIIYGYLVVGAVLLQSCVKFAGQENAKPFINFNQRSTVRLYNATVASAGALLYVDGALTSGSAIAYGANFPTSAPGFTVLGGYRELQITGTAPYPVQSFAENFQAGNYYSIFMYDTVNAAKVKTIQTTIVIPGDTTARVRFANFSYWPGTQPGIDIFSVKRGSLVVANLLPTQVSDYIPYASALSDSLIVFENGTNVRLDTLVGFNPTRKRSYTLLFRGRYRVNESILPPATTASTNPRLLTAIADY